MNEKNLHRCICCKNCHYNIHEPVWWESDRRVYDYYYCYNPDWFDKARLIDNPQEKIECDCFELNEDELDEEW